MRSYTPSRRDITNVLNFFSSVIFARLVPSHIYIIKVRNKTSLSHPLYIRSSIRGQERSLVYTFSICIYKLVNILYIQMPKKYLLYIHDEKQFDAVKDKSKLINQLLNEYWTNKPSTTKIAEVTIPKADIYKLSKTTYQELKPTDNIQFCKHNAVIGFCKKGC